MCGLWDGEAEARWVGEEIEHLQKTGIMLRSIAVLVRTGFQTREFEERFIKLGVPYKVIGGPRFYERMEIRDALAYFRVIVQQSDDLALERIINTPKRGIGNTTVNTLYAHARAHNMSLYAAVADVTQTDELRPKTRATLIKLLDDFNRWRSLMETAYHAELAQTVLDESGYAQMWKDDKTPEAPGRLENLKELVGGMQDYSSLQEFLEHVALVLENQDSASGDFITLMTLHGAKGLEFDNVFLPGWEEGLFPSQRAMDENGVKGLEEERRLAYVGLTRARKRAFISHAATRYTYGNWNNTVPSRFIDELPDDLVDVHSQSTMVREGRSRHWDSSGHAPKIKTAPASFSPKVQSEKGDIFSRGDRVFHQKFGQGTIINIDGHKLDIAFDQGGHKRVMDSFVEKG